SFTRSDPARDFFFRLFALDQLFEDQRLSRRGGDRLGLGHIERRAQRERRLGHRSNEWRFAGRQDRRLFLPPARLAFLGITKFFVQDENRRRDFLVQLERRAHIFETVVGDFAMSSGAIERFEGATIHSFTL